MTLPAPAEILERERRFSRPAGIAAILGAILTIAGLFIRGSALDGDSTSELLLDAATGDADGQLMLGAVTSGLGLILLAVPLTLLFLAARDRSERVRGAFLYLAATGAILLAVGGIVNNTAYLNAADDFAAEEEQSSALPSGTLLAQAETTVEATTAGEDDGAATSTSESSSEEDEEEDANDRARDAIKDASGFSVSAGLQLAGTFAFAIGFFYTSLWAMRTGLMTRFWGSLGMACAVVFVLIVPSSPPIIIFQLVWFMALGFMLLGVWVGGRPPAWETGTAVPWLKPGEEPPGEDGDPDLIEGEGRDVSGDRAGRPAAQAQAAPVGTAPGHRIDSRRPIQRSIWGRGPGREKHERHPCAGNRPDAGALRRHRAGRGLRKRR